MSTPYAKALVRIAGGAQQSGGITVSASQSVALEGENTSGWRVAVWQIIGPPGWSTPAGWTDVDGVATYNGTTENPPSWTLPAASGWGKWAVTLTVNGGEKDGDAAHPEMVDTTLMLSMASSNGISDVAVGESAQFDALRGWTGPLQDMLRVVDTTLGLISGAAELVTLVGTGSGGGDFLVGDVVCSANDAADEKKFKLATTANLANADPSSFRVILETGAAGASVQAAGPGDVVAASVFGFSTSTSHSYALLNTTTGRAARQTAELSGGERVLGAVDTAGNVTINPIAQIAAPVIHLMSPRIGAKCDGVTDDTAAWKAAVAACGFAGTILFGEVKGENETKSVIREPIDFGTTANGQTQSTIRVMAATPPRTGFKDVYIINKVEDFRGGNATIDSKTGSLVRVKIPAADWATAMARTARGSITYVDSPADVESLQLELTRCTTNASNDSFPIAAVYNDNRDDNGYVWLDVYDVGGLCGATDASNGSIDWRVKRHLFGVYAPRLSFTNFSIITDTGVQCSYLFDYNEHADQDLTVSFFDLEGIGHNSTTNWQVEAGVCRGRAICPRPGRASYKAASGSYTARANSTAYSVGDRRVVVGATTNPNALYECTVAGTSAAGAPGTFTDSCLQYDWGTLVVDGTVTWKRVYPGSTAIASQTARANSTAYTVGAIRFSATSTGRKRQMRFRCIVAGTSGTSEPAAMTATGTHSKDAPEVNVVITDGTVTWISEYDAAPPIGSYRPNLDFNASRNCFLRKCRASFLDDSNTAQCREHTYDEVQVSECCFGVATAADIRFSYTAKPGYCKVLWRGGGAQNCYDAFLYAPGLPGWDAKVFDAYCEGGGRIVWGGGGHDFVFRGGVLSAAVSIGTLSGVTSAGTTPPVITLTGTPKFWMKLRIECNAVGGARGTWQLRYSFNDGVTWWASAVLSAATVELGHSGITANIATGNASTNNVWTATMTQPDRRGLLHRTLIESSAQEIVIEDCTLNMTGSGDIAPIVAIGLDGSVGYQTAQQQKVAISRVTSSQSDRRGTPASNKSARREPFRLANSDTLQVTYTAAAGSTFATTVFTATFLTADFADITRATAAEMAVVLNLATAGFIRWWSDGWGFLWWASIASGLQGIATGSDSVTIAAGAVTTATGLPTATSQVYGEQRVTKDSSRVVYPPATGNAVANEGTISRKLRIQPGHIRNSAQVWQPWPAVDVDYIGSGVASGADFGRRMSSLALQSEQAVPLRNFSGEITFAEDITSVPIIFPIKEDDTAYDVVFDMQPKAIVGAPAAGKPVVFDAQKRATGCRAERVTDGTATPAPCGAGTSAKYGYTIKRRRVRAWTPQDMLALTLKGWFKNEDITAGAFASWANSATGTNLISALTSATGPTGTVGTGPRGRNYLTFDGVNDYLAGTISTAYAQQYAVIMALKMVAASGKVFANAAGNVFATPNNGTPKVDVNAGSTVAQTGSWGTLTNDFVLGILFDGVLYGGAGTNYGWRIHKNGAPISSQGWAALGTNSLDGLVIGAEDATPGTYTNFVCYETIVATVAAGATRVDVLDDLARCEGYLVDKFGV